jgi:hypothetical protein
MSRKHDWASLQTYLNVHERVLNTYAKFMDTPRAYQQTFVTANYLLLECMGIMFTTYKGTKVRVDITKDVEIDDSNPKRHRAVTVGYSYNANEPRVGNRFRYDSPDSPAQLGPESPPHHYFHHKHVWNNGKEQILPIGDDDWPHIDEFFREVQSTC